MDTSTKQHYVYKITCLETGEYYYGKRSCNGSWKDDPYMGSGQILKRKIKAHPEYTWTKEVLLLLDSSEEALEYEAVVIGNKFKGGEDWDGLCLNLTAGGLGSRGCSRSEEHRAKISEAAKGNQRALGVVRSEETKAKISKALKGHQNWLGKTHSEETKAKIGAGNKGKIVSEEAKAKMSAARKAYWEKKRAEKAQQNIESI